MNMDWQTASPLAPLAPGERRYLAIDGACFPSGMRGLHDLGVRDTPAQVLADGVHDALATVGAWRATGTTVTLPWRGPWCSTPG